MFAALPMYARPENRAAHDALWALIRDGLRVRGMDAPDALDHDATFDAGWGRRDLVLGQICNLPWRTRHRADTVLVGAADHGVEGVAPGFYRSVYVVRRDDPARGLEYLAGRRMALNDPLSHSGWGAVQADAAARGVTLVPALVTGSHRGSIRAVATGSADFAAIDAHTWWVECRFGVPGTAGLRVADTSPPAPGITFVTAPGRDVAATGDAVRDAIDALSPDHRATLGLRGIVRLPAGAYDIPLPPAPVLPGGAALA